MTPRELLRQTAKRFAEAGVPNPETDSALLLESLLHRPALQLRLDTDTVLTAAELGRFEALVLRRLTRRPLQYLTGEVGFFGQVFLVDDRVLIPRPETELLVERGIAAAKAWREPRVLDLCCGSGCIGISVALALGAEVHASDLSADALAVARTNAERLGAAVVFHQGDLLDWVRGERFHVLLSNPPYIPTKDCTELQQEVRFEPITALDGGADGLDFYRRIAQTAPKVLEADGVLLMELGDGETAAVSELLRAAGWRDVQVFEDYAGLPRMIQAVWG